MESTAALQKIGDQGVLGALLVLSLIVVYALFKMLIAEKDKRREDAEQLNDGLLEPIRQLKLNSETQTTMLRQFLEKVKL